MKRCLMKCLIDMLFNENEFGFKKNLNVDMKSGRMVYMKILNL